MKRRTSLLIGIWGLVAGVAAGDEPSKANSHGGRPTAAIQWLQEYLQIDTTNPPGGEKPAAEFLAKLARAAGADDTRLLADDEGRVSLVAHFEATAPSCGGGLVLMHHIDVVPAGDGWENPPFSGRFHQDRIWGRGAIDIKSLGIAQLAAVGALRAEGRAFCRDLHFVAVADEESGGVHGTRFLLERHPTLFANVEAVLNEGGHNRVNQGRVVFWGIEVVQKRPLWLKVEARGRGGHGSRFSPSSPTHRLVKALAKLIEQPLVYRLSPAARLFFGKLAVLENRDPTAGLRELEAILYSENPTAGLGPGQQVYFVDNVQVTEIQTGAGINVVSPRAFAYVDIRLLPDTDGKAFLEKVRGALGPEVDVEVVLDAPEVPPSPLEHPLYQALTATLGTRAPVIPSFLPGTTDSRYFRERGVAAYGFSPFAINGPDLGGIHAPNEYIRPADFLRGVETLRRLLETYATTP